MPLAVIATIPSLACAALALSLLLFVVVKKRGVPNPRFSFIIGGVAIWQVANALVLTADLPAAAEFWSRFAYIGAVLIPLGVWHFCLDMAEVRPPPRLVAAVYVSGFAFLYFFLTEKWFLSGVHHYPWGYWFKAGPYHPAYLVYFSALFFTGPLLLFLRSRQPVTNKQKFLIQGVFWTFVIGAAGSIDYVPDYGVNILPLGAVPVAGAVILMAHLVLFNGLLDLALVDWPVFYRVLDRFETWAPRAGMREDILRVAALKANQKVMEVTGGTGALAKDIALTGAHYTGLILQEESVAYRQAQSWPKNVSFRQGDPAGAMDFPDHSIDAVFFVHALWFFHPSTYGHLLTETRRILKPGGRLVICDVTPTASFFGILASHMAQSFRRRGFIQTASETFLAAPDILRLFYYLTVIFSQNLVIFDRSLETHHMLALLQENGFKPETIARTNAGQNLLFSALAQEKPPALTVVPAAGRALPAEALRAFEVALGRENVRVDGLEAYERNTLSAPRRVAAVVRPASTEELQEVVRIAARWRAPLYPVSSGHNWGYGTASPVGDDNVLVDLGRMNRILEVNQDLAYAVIEPGVTQAQLYRYLEDHGLSLAIDPTGAGPTCSLVGNALERGFGLGAYSDHFGSTCGMEVVTAQGELLKTGFGQFENARSRWTYKWGLGPFLEGIFSQSNLGIVTKMGLWLYPKPERVELCLVQCRDEAQLGRFVDTVRPLFLQGSLRGSLMIAHRNRALTLSGQYPWEEMGGRTPMTEALGARLGKTARLALWNGIIPIYGTKEEVAAAKKVIKRTLKPVSERIAFINEGSLWVLKYLRRPLSVLLNLDIPGVMETLKFTFGIAKGVPGERSLRMSYWRNTGTLLPRKDIDPEADHCGLIWFVPIVPMTSAHVRDFLGIIKPICEHHGFEMCAAFTTVNHRAFDCTLPIFYDRLNPEETKRAQACFDDLMKQCLEQGFVPYRLGIQSMAQFAKPGTPFWDTVAKIKTALDPLGILSPGHYAPADESAPREQRPFRL